MTQKPGLIDQTLVDGEILFATSRERCAYLGTETRYRQKWLADRPHSWRYVHDVLGEADLLEKTKTEVGTAECGSNVRKDGNDEDDVALVDSLVVDRSPPCELTSLPTPVKANVPNGSTKAELLAHRGGHEEVMEPRPETTPSRRRAANEVAAAIANSRSKNCRQKSRKPAESFRLSACGLSSTASRNIPSYPTQLLRRAFTAKRLSIGSSAALPATMDTTSSGKALDWRFHNLCESAIAEAHDRVLAAMLDKLDMGGVVYKNDEFLLSLGYEGPDAYLRDENGDPLYADHSQNEPEDARARLGVDASRQCGARIGRLTFRIRVVACLSSATLTKKTSKIASAASIKARKWKSGLRMIRKAKT